MKITSAHTRAEVRRQFTIQTDHPVVGMAYSSPPKQIRVVRGSVTYSWIDGAWTVKDAWAMSVGGPVLKKDGTDGKNDHNRRPDENYKLSRELGRLILTQEFEWLYPIVELLRPTPEMGMMVLNESEVG
jgi:hypothetical protein